MLTSELLTLQQTETAVVLNFRVKSVPGKMVSVWFNKWASFAAASLKLGADSVCNITVKVLLS